MPLLNRSWQWIGQVSRTGATALAMAAVLLIAPNPSASAQKPAQPAPTPPADAQPSPQLTPEDVIRLQIEALSSPGPIPPRIERCYRFASPANREHTGPIRRFTEMIELPKYRVLLGARKFLVGRATRAGNEAHLLLTVVDRDGNLALFRCFLSQQAAAPFANCWMTDAVVRIGDAVPADPAPDRSPQPAPTI